MIGFASLIMGLVVAGSAWAVVSAVFAERSKFKQASSFDKERRIKLREQDFVFRNFEAVIDEITERFNDDKKINEFGEALSTSGTDLPWQPREFLAAKLIESTFAAIAAFLFCFVILKYSIVTVVVLSVSAAFGWYWLTKNSVLKKSSKRRKKIKRDFSAAIDLLALMMEVGGSFLDSLKVVAREYRGKSLGDELGSIVNDIELGKPRKQALLSFEKRMVDEDVSEVVFACNESEELGVPISETLRSQAERIRQKRSSWAEKAAQEAEVALTFPAMVIMLACLLTVGAPFILSGMESWRESF